MKDRLKNFEEALKILTEKLMGAVKNQQKLIEIQRVQIEEILKRLEGQEQVNLFFLPLLVKAYPKTQQAFLESLPRLQNTLKGMGGESWLKSHFAEISKLVEKSEKPPFLKVLDNNGGN